MSETMELSEYRKTFNLIGADFEETVASFGLPFESEETADRTKRSNDAHWACENAGASLVGGGRWVSPACIACRTGERTATFFISLACPKHCYFCFNPNQEHYTYFLTHTRDIVGELEAAHAEHVGFDCLAVTGGEPLLHADELAAFLKRAAELYPESHTRLYTSGAGLDDTLLARLRDAGLDEIRFSVKWEDDEAEREQLYDLMGRSVGVIPSVMVETPVIPGMIENMKALLTRLDALGLAGVNLLEFCFPLHNAEAFAERGFELRKRPYGVLYDYWYAGGLPVAGSEADSLELLRFAQAEQLKLGVHYCSSDNKNSGQFFQQNKNFSTDAASQGRYPYLSFDEETYLLVCAKAFGSWVDPVREALDALGCSGSGARGYRVDLDVPMISFPLEFAASVVATVEGVEVGRSIQVLEQVAQADTELTGISARELDLVVFGE